MVTRYSEEDLLPLSGIQHFAFCERQWGLIHIERQWNENVLTAEGRLMHEKVDDPYSDNTRADVKIIRSVPLISRKLGFYGVADVIEVHKAYESREDVKYSIVEYKRGKPKKDEIDEVQLCAQAVCLEEMLNIKLEHGFVYYGEIRHRHKVLLDESLRTKVEEMAKKMHFLFEKGETPSPILKNHCKNCSLVHICMPKHLSDRGKAKTYLRGIIREMERELQE